MLTTQCDKITDKKEMYDIGEEKICSSKMNLIYLYLFFVRILQQLIKDYTYFYKNRQYKDI